MIRTNSGATDCNGAQFLLILLSDTFVEPKSVKILQSQCVEPHLVEILKKLRIFIPLNNWTTTEQLDDD